MAVMLLLFFYSLYSVSGFRHPIVSSGRSLLHFMRLAKTFGQTFLKILNVLQ